MPRCESTSLTERQFYFRATSTAPPSKRGVGGKQQDLRPEWKQGHLQEPLVRLGEGFGLYPTGDQEEGRILSKSTNFLFDFWQSWEGSKTKILETI